MKRIIWIIVSACIAAAISLWLLVFPPSAMRAASVTIGKTTFTVEIADTISTRAQGLSGRESLAAKSGMLFMFSEPGRYGFWMKDMHFALDLVWIREGIVVGITENALPVAPGEQIVAYYPPEPADMVLEVNAGEAAASGIVRGSAVEFLLQ